LTTEKTYDVAVIGAGVFGAWIARYLQSAGQRVILIDAYGPAHSRSSSGGESRIIRLGYGADEFYSRLSMRALVLWKEFFEHTGEDLLHPTGLLMLADEADTIVTATETILEKLGVKTERLSREDVRKRFPQFAPERFAWALFEPDSGVLLARRAVQAVVRESLKDGADYLPGKAVTPSGKGQLGSILTQQGDTIRAGLFVFACGPWLPKVFPELLGDRIFPTRQEILFFGAPAGDASFKSPALPAWIYRADGMYGMPDLENRGVKISNDNHGPGIDPDTDERTLTPAAISTVRDYLTGLFPALAGAPLVETRVCQYENTSNGDFLIDRHPSFSNVWLVGGGSGHGFKHGPALGEYVARLALEGGAVDPRFSLATKEIRQKRAVF
jgi:monomeric sarcosine oxidase